MKGREQAQCNAFDDAMARFGREAVLDDVVLYAVMHRLLDADDRTAVHVLLDALATVCAERRSLIAEKIAARARQPVTLVVPTGSVEP